MSSALLITGVKDTAVDPTERARVLAARRRLKMARSAHAYVRGSTRHFYEWLGKASVKLPVGPEIWICGDCHVGNLGPVGKVAGTPDIELRDLDQTAVGNPAYDLVRLALSLAMAGRGSDLGGVTTARMAEDLIAGYELALSGDAPAASAAELPKPIRLVMKRAVRRTWKKLFRERVGQGKRALPLGKRFWPLARVEREAVEQLVSIPELASLVTRLEHRADNATVELVDAAYWVKGCSSLGMWRAAVLVDVVEPDNDKHSLCLLDIKEAGKTFAPHVEGTPEDPAARVVMGARKLAPSLGERMAAVHMLDRSLFVRELMPQDLKVELDELSAEDARGVAHCLGTVVGRAHGRQLAANDRASWLAEIAAHRSKTLDAPSWLWRAVVELVAIHEAAYLEHCRLYALEPDKLVA
ncbi:MAG TPA: DUF2252 family protein [Kofleriaceae bacterium]|nr:DUF2252 family protein [Kofleriaceae bacterium]